MTTIKSYLRALGVKTNIIIVTTIMEGKHIHTNTHTHTYIYIYIYMCVCVCVI